MPSLDPHQVKMESDFRILAQGQGLFRTIQTGAAVDADGRPIPWFTYPATEYLSQFDFRGKKIFEYGCGNSSLYWIRRGANTWSVDHNQVWYQKMNEQLGEKLYFCPDGESYVAAISRPNEQFDVIVIDGEWRVECASVVLDYLAPGGFIILDNSDRDWDAALVLRNKKLFEVDFSGFGPINDYTWTTSIFLSGCHVDQAGFSPPTPIGGYKFEGEK